MTTEKCGATKKQGGECTQAAGWGTEHPGIGRCKLHGGSTRNHVKAAEVEVARRECERLGIPVEINPGEALMRELWETAGNVAFYRALVQELPVHPEPDVHHPGEDGGYWERGEPGVYGRTYHVSGVPTGEAKPNILVTLYNDERKHLAAVAGAALKAGVEERRVQMAEVDAQRIFDAQVEALKSIGMGDKLDQFRIAFGDALRGAQPARLASS